MRTLSAFAATFALAGLAAGVFGAITIVVHQSDLPASFEVVDAHFD